MVSKEYVRSSSDDEELGDEFTTFLESRSRTTRGRCDTQTSRQRLCRLLTTLATYIAISLFSVLSYELSRKAMTYPDNTINLLPGRELLPHFPHNTLTTFVSNTIFHGHDSSQAWKSLNAKGGGWITVPDGEALGLGPPIRYNNKEGYGISVFHQLHCMAMMHDTYIQLLAGNFSHTDQKSTHIEHCFDYIRQVLMCHADLSLEHRWHSPDEAPDNDAVNGWDVVHQCRDWNAVVSFVEENALTKGWNRSKNFGHHDSSHGRSEFLDNSRP